jgi:hypothetical protein
LADAPDAAANVLRNLLARYPSDTQMQAFWKPVIEAAIALSRGDPKRAIAGLGLLGIAQK